MGAAARATNDSAPPIVGGNAEGVPESPTSTSPHVDFDGFSGPAYPAFRIGKLDKYGLPPELEKFLRNKPDPESRAFLEMWERPVNELPPQVRILESEQRDLILAHFGATITLMEEKYPLHLQKGLVLLTFAHPHAPFATDVGPVEMGVGFPTWEYSSLGIIEKHHDPAYELAPVFVRMDTIPLETGRLLWFTAIAALNTFRKEGRPAESYFLKRDPVFEGGDKPK